MLFNWLITGEVAPFNPVSAVRGPKHVVRTGVTPVLDGAEWRKLVDAIPMVTVRDLRDRALIATLTYSFARITAALKMKVEDLRPQGAGWQLRLHERWVTQCRATMRSPKRCGPISMRQTSWKTARAAYSARRAGTPPRPCPTSPWGKRTPGA